MVPPWYRESTSVLDKARLYAATSSIWPVKKLPVASKMPPPPMLKLNPDVPMAPLIAAEDRSVPSRYNWSWLPVATPAMWCHSPAGNGYAKSIWPANVQSSIVVALTNPNSTRSFCPNNPARGFCAKGRIQPASVNIDWLFNSGLGIEMKLLLPLNVGALLFGSNPLNCGGRGPAVPRVALV